jgi:hypothetical protein
MTRTWKKMRLAVEIYEQTDMKRKTIRSSSIDIEKNRYIVYI